MMNSMIAFLMWLFGWGAPMPVSVTKAPLPAVGSQQNAPTLEDYSPENYSQQVTIIIYDDTFFGVKR